MNFNERRNRQHHTSCMCTSTTKGRESLEQQREEKEREPAAIGAEWALREKARVRARLRTLGRVPVISHQERELYILQHRQTHSYYDKGRRTPAMQAKKKRDKNRRAHAHAKHVNVHVLVTCACFLTHTHTSGAPGSAGT